MSVGRVLGRGRRAAEALMTDTVAVSYPDGTTFDETAGESVTAYTPRFTSAARFKSVQTQPLQDEVGGRTVTTFREVMELPALSPTLPQAGDRVRIDAVDERLSNPARVGLTYMVLGAPVGSQETKIRVPVERVSA